jgi:hypothetical protein
MDGVNTAHDIAALVPSLKLERVVPSRDQEIIGGDRERLFPGLEQHRVGARCQESPDHFRDIGHEESRTTSLRYSCNRPC